MVLFPSNTDPKYQLLDTPRKKSKSVAHSWAIFGLIVLSISIVLISVIILWDQIKQMQHKTETLDFVLFGPKREAPSSDVTRFSEYRALMYAGANKDATSNETYKTRDFFSSHRSSESVETFQHVEKPYTLVCYYVTPSRSSSNDKLAPEDIDPFLCTHIIVSFASVEKNRLHFTDNAVMDAVIKLRSKNSKLKVLLSVVSFNSADQGFATMVTNKTTRSDFIESAMQLIIEYSLDGIDLDWEFPAWPPSKDVNQRYQFVRLLKEMRERFQSKYLITVAVASPLPIIEQSYDVPAIAKYVDFVNVMCYDYYSFVWYLPFVGPNAPLYAGPKDLGYWRTLNTNYSIHTWQMRGMPKNKIVLGMPIYGHSWTLEKPEDHDYGAIAAGFGSIGEKGFVSYRDACNFTQREGVKTVFDGETREPYAYHETEWFSFDNITSLRYKANYVTEHGLGGAMIFSLNQDDFNGTVCNHGEKFPLVKSVKKVLEDDGL